MSLWFRVVGAVMELVLIFFEENSEIPWEQDWYQIQPPRAVQTALVHKPLRYRRFLGMRNVVDLVKQFGTIKKLSDQKTNTSESSKAFCGQFTATYTAEIYK